MWYESRKKERIERVEMNEGRKLYMIFLLGEKRKEEMK